MKILALVASQDSTVEDVKTNGRRQMQALIGKDKEVLFCEYSTIEICVSFRSQEVRLQLIRDLHRMEYGCLIRWCFSKILIPKHCLVVLVIHLL